MEVSTSIKLITTSSSRRFLYATLLGLTIALGLLSRSSVVPIDSPIRHYAGDALWALAVFWSLAIVAPLTQTRWFFVATLLISLAIELSQLYHAEWIDNIRAFKPAALILGHTFLWSDLVCYTVGACVGALFDHQLIRKERQSPWNWWLHSTIKDKLLFFGVFYLGLNGILLTVNLVELKTLSVGVVLLFVGLMMKSEESTDI